MDILCFESFQPILLFLFGGLKQLVSLFTFLFIIVAFCLNTLSSHVKNLCSFSIFLLFVFVVALWFYLFFGVLLSLVV